MRTKTIAIIAAFLAAIVAIAALALGPLKIMNLAAPGRGTNPVPQATTITTPTWHTGDSWTYHVNASTFAPTQGDPAVVGNVTRTVVSADSSQDNVSVSGSFRVRPFLGLADDPEFENAAATLPVVLPTPVIMQNASLSGFTWYRPSDLAELRDVRTIRLNGSIATPIGTFTATYTAKVVTTYNPAFDVWAFPIRENATWNASSNATIQVWIKWRLDGPNVDFEFGHNFTATVPVRLVLASGMVGDATTPAGTFPSIPVRLAVPPTILAGASTSFGVALGLGMDAWTLPRVSTEVWFSGTVGNIVKAVIPAGGTRIVAELTSYHRA